MAGERILVVEDDERLLDLTLEYLRNEGYDAFPATDGVAALQVWREQHPDLVVLDWMLPGQSGLDVARQIRQQGRTPIIMVTARSEEPDKLLGLEMGADDYLTKPFSLRELLARIRAVLRRTHPGNDPPEHLTFGEICIDLGGHVVQRAGADISLTATEFKLLTVLAGRPNRVFSRLQLMEAAIGDYYEGYERTIDTHISHLRRKLGAPALIQTVHGIGYKLVPPRG